METVEYAVMAAVEDRHWWYSGMRAISAAWLDPVYGGRGDLRILDAGCGTGGNGEWLRRYGHSTGLDLAPDALRLGARRLPGTITGGSVMELPFGAATFDLVTSFDVLYHRAVVDERRALVETWRVLKPGGRLLLRLPAYEWLQAKHDRAVHTRHRYTLDEVRRLLAPALEVERISYINTLLFPLALAQRLRERWLAHADEPADAPSDLALPPAWLNDALRAVMLLEAAWLRRATFGAGLSVLALARKPVE
jgi:SAM-dependent methyltransferase